MGVGIGGMVAVGVTDGPEVGGSRVGSMVEGAGGGTRRWMVATAAVGWAATAGLGEGARPPRATITTPASPTPMMAHQKGQGARSGGWPGLRGRGTGMQVLRGGSPQEISEGSRFCGAEAAVASPGYCSMLLNS